MKKLKIAVVLLFVLGGVAVFLGDQQMMNVAKSFSNGPPPGFTGAPSENSCSACHSGKVGNGQFAILSVPANYQPGQTYGIQVRHINANPTRLRWGFELTALDGSENAAGTFANLSPATQVITDNGRFYIEQTRDGSASGQQGGALWTFNWTAPATNVGPVTFYAAGNQANNDNQSDGDEIYLTTATSLGPGMTPTPTATPTGTPTATPTATPTPTPAGLEADIAPRPNGDGFHLASDVVQIRRFVVGLDIPNTATTEYQRADSSPIGSRGNGAIDATDTIQTRRYVAGLDAPQPVGGPTGPPMSPEGEDSILDDVWRYFFGYEIKVGDVVTERGKTITMVLDTNGAGDAAAASFTVDFDPSVLGDPRVAGAHDDLHQSITVNSSYAAEGQIGILADSSGPLGDIHITFTVLDKAGVDETNISFSDGLTKRAVSDGSGVAIPVRFTGGTVTIK